MLYGVAVNQHNHVAQNSLKIERRNLDLPFSDQFAHAVDYFTRASSVIDNVPKDGPDLLKGSRVGSQETHGGLGVAKNCRERLTQFMCQGRREFAHSADSCDMG